MFRLDLLPRHELPRSLRAFCVKALVAQAQYAMILQFEDGVRAARKGIRAIGQLKLWPCSRSLFVRRRTRPQTPRLEYGSLRYESAQNIRARLPRPTE
jgi:hypothetical protein